MSFESAPYLQRRLQSDLGMIQGEGIREAWVDSNSIGDMVKYLSTCLMSGFERDGEDSGVCCVNDRMVKRYKQELKIYLGQASLLDPRSMTRYRIASVLYRVPAPTIEAPTHNHVALRNVEHPPSREIGKSRGS